LTGNLLAYSICMYISRTFFWQEFTLQNWDAAYARNIIPFDDRARDAGIVCCETTSRYRLCLRLLSCKLLHARIRQNISGVSAYFDYMRVADTIDSQKSEDRDITDRLPQMLLATTKAPRMQSQIFYFHTGKI
jgi:hypothetical protein